MPTHVLDLWPEAIRAEVQTPYSILLAQTNLLTDRTSNVLVGELRGYTAKIRLHSAGFGVLCPGPNCYNGPYP